MGRSFQKDTDRMPLEGFLIPYGGFFLFMAEVLHFLALRSSIYLSRIIY